MELQNKYYSIGEVAELLDVNSSKIRYWERQFSQFVRPRRSRRGDRMFTVKDIETLQLIKHLVNDLGFTLDGAKQYLKYHKKELEAKIEVIDRLKKVRDMLEELKASLE